MSDAVLNLLQRVNATTSDYPCNQGLHQLIDEQAERTPNRIAFEAGDDQLTYRELQSRSNHLANLLLKRMEQEGIKQEGTNPGPLVGLCCERNLDTIVALLAILKAGAGYLPLDPDYPAERLQYMVEDAGSKLILAHRSLEQLATSFGPSVLWLDEALSGDVATKAGSAPDIAIDAASHVAYVIYTSGSTGKPKGVLVPHQCAVNLLWPMRDKFFTQDDVMLGLTTLSFDISVAEMFLPLICGGKTAIVDRRVARDGQLLIKAIEKHRPTLMQATPSTWRFVIEAGWSASDRPDNFRIVSTGEPLPRDLVQPLLDRCDVLWNWYGPTETTVWSTRYRVTDASARVLIGEPWENTNLYIVDEQDHCLGVDEEGELLIGGDGVTLGYLNRKELTDERFVMFNGERVYRTGDLAKFTPDGEVECLGRIDSQVKLHGYRIELEEIDAALASHPTVKRAATTVREDVPGDKRLIGYVIPEVADGFDVKEVRKSIERHLPDYMVPSALMVVDSFQQTPSGKLDRNALPKPTLTRPDVGAFVAPRNEREEAMSAIWTNVLQLDRVGVQDNFFQLGGNSILALKAIAQMQSQLGLSLNAPELFDNPTIRQIAGYVDDKSNMTKQLNRPRNGVPSNEFAIVGMAARLPGADNVREFWRNLCDGVESITFFSPEELDPTLDPEVVADENYVAARGIVEDADKFDAKFFGVTPREAKLIDPQQRVLVEVAWAALEDAHCVPDNYSGTIGVWAGTYSNTYFTKNVLTNPELIEQTGEFQMGVYNEKDYIATRIAHKLNLTGPAVNLNTACSTSLVTIIEACNSLALGHCDMALAGAASITFPQNSGHTYQTANIMSPDGHCRPFDSEAAGTLFSDGAGMVVVKRLVDAIADGDRIYATIKGVGINNDGGKKASFTAPSIQGQASAVAMAHAHANVPAETIGYIETHGTATPIGDPIEVQALTGVFASQTERKQFCAIGSVKSNVGHTVAAAGVTGIIKTTLSLYHEQIPPTLHYEKPNPQIDFESSPFFVCDELREWPRNETPRRAGVSSFGVGGTNAHIVLEEAPAAANCSKTSPCQQRCSSRTPLPVQLLPISASHVDSRDEMVNSLADFFADASSELDDLSGLDAAAYTLQTSRARFNKRAFAVAATSDEASTVCRDRKPGRYSAGEFDGQQREVCFMFPGQGSQYVWMGKNLYDHAPVFREAMDECCDILAPLLEQDLRDVLYPQDGNDKAAAEILRATRFTQPAIFALGYSLAKLWQSWGLEPACLIGHSIGEFVAACLAGVFSLEDGLRMIAERGRLMQELPGGSMLSVRAPAVQIEPLLIGKLAMASYNGPKLCVVAGPDDEIESLRQKLDGQDIPCKTLHTSHAFHSSMMEPIVEPYRQFVANIALSPPATPLMSTVTGKWMSDSEATDPAYWADHMRAAVAFSPAIEALWQDDPTRVMLELGPRTTLATLARQHATDKTKQHSIASLSDNAADNTEWYSILSAVGKLWLLGIEFDWQSLHPANPQKCSLPTYPFRRERHFVEPGIGMETQNASPTGLQQAPCSNALNETPTISTTKLTTITMTRRDQIINEVNSILENTSGIDATEFDSSMTFFEMGMDSLVLTQTAAAMKKKLGVNVSFRKMLEETPTVDSLVDFLDGEIPADQFADVVEETVVAAPPAEPAASATVNAVPANVPTANFAPVNLTASNAASTGFDSLMHNQLQIIQQQLQILSGGQNTIAAPVALTAATTGQGQPSAATSKTGITESSSAPSSKGSDAPVKKAFGAAARVNLNSEQLTNEQQQLLCNFIDQYVALTSKSKEYAQKHREYLADPRTVSGFRPALKEITYPIVAERSEGAYLWDIDGNRYVDFICGFGSNFLGHTVDFMVDAMTEQLKRGYEIGPQTPLAGEVAKLFCELTGAERCAFANTGSEAVLAATRLARAVTGRDLIVMFTGDYHGILDEVVVRGNKKLKSFAAATGIPSSHVENTLILEYGTDESLRIIEERLDDIAAVVVETVQSRRPEFQPKAFLQKLGKLTENNDAALIFDEVITGFRIAAGGAQEHFGVKADIASYGKIVGGGMPIGMVAGKAKYMDGLDGGFWKFGDDSKPEIGMTYFAGTFVRHPVTMAASKRILEHIRDNKNTIYDRLNALSDRLAREVNQIFKERGLPAFLANFGSLFKVQFEEELPWGELLFAQLRARGIHVWDHRPCLLTASHTDADIDEIVKAFRDSVVELQVNGFLPGDTSQQVSNENAKLGKDKNGKPAWYVPDANNPGQFIQVPAPQ